MKSTAPAARVYHTNVTDVDVSLQEWLYGATYDKSEPGPVLPGSELLPDQSDFPGRNPPGLRRFDNKRVTMSNCATIRIKDSAERYKQQLVDIGAQSQAPQLQADVSTAIDSIVERFPKPHPTFPTVLEAAVPHVAAGLADCRLPPGTLPALTHELALHFNTNVAVVTSTRGEGLRFWELIRDSMMPQADCVLRWALRAAAEQESRVAIMEYAVPGDNESGVDDFCHTYVLLYQHQDSKVLFCDVDGETLMEADAAVRGVVGNLDVSVQWMQKCHHRVQLVCFRLIALLPICCVIGCI